MTAIAKFPTPILNTPDFEGLYSHLPFPWEKGHLKAILTVALPNTKFTIVKEHPGHIYEVETADYPIIKPLFVDARFLEKVPPETGERQRQLPPAQTILERLQALEGIPYVWGGNYSPGIPEMLQLYPPPESLDEKTLRTWTLGGVDCSGLLYQVTDGSTPRDTSQLVFYGSPLSIQGLSAEQIAEKLQPLDAIVWKGHIILVFDKDTTIESHGERNVVKTDLLTRLKEVLLEHTPADEWQPDHFVVRRWIPLDE